MNFHHNKQLVLYLKVVCNKKVCYSTNYLKGAACLRAQHCIDDLYFSSSLFPLLLTFAVFAARGHEQFLLHFKLL